MSTMTTSPGKKGWFYRFMLGYTLLHLAWMAVLIYDFISHPLAPDPLLGSVAYRLFIVLGITPLALAVSILVLRRTPGNITGLCLLLWSVLIFGQAVPAESPIYIHNGIFNTGWVGLWLLALYFPDGRPVPRRFERWIKVLSAYAVLSILFWGFFQPTSNNFNAANPAEVKVPNPLFIPALLPLQPLANVLESVGLISVVILIIPSLILRYRASSLKERLQIKWLVWTYVLLIISVLFLAPSGLISGDQYKYDIPGLMVVWIWGLYITLAPYISVGVAILRHRLYDIDIIIRRTLQYSLLTGLLSLVYFGGVALLQNLLTTDRGPQTATSPAVSGPPSAVVIVLTTLLIAALFNPLRRRIQDFIDKRFYRQKYDAEKALAEFAEVARSETHLEALTTQVVNIVRRTMQPEQVSIWLQPEAGLHPSSNDPMGKEAEAQTPSPDIAG
jgi:hypothetical protein